MNKNIKKVSVPISPVEVEMHQQQQHSDTRNDKMLRGAAIPVDTDLILDILVLYTEEALWDFSYRSVANTFCR